MRFAHSGDHDEYQVSTLRHSDFGFRMMTVSSIESGAGSVEVSARPAFPSTRSTSGNCFMMRSVTCNNRCASPMEMPGIVDGMYKTEPSSSGGINSEPRRKKTGTVATISNSAEPPRPTSNAASTPLPVHRPASATRLTGCLVFRADLPYQERVGRSA